MQTELSCKLFSILLLSFIFLMACSSKKNTGTTRLYHSINTKYNIYFNAEEAYKEALKSKEDGYSDNLSRLLPVYPLDSQSEETKQLGGAFTRTVDKTTKAIKLHSIKAKPKGDAKKKRDPKYQMWLQQQEFNPFLKNAWLLLGKAEFQDEDYLKAASTFSYITRLYKGNPEVVAEARLWMARSYATMGWFYEAEDNFHKIELAGGITPSLQYDYAKIYADYLVRKQEYNQAIPYLEKAIEGGGSQKMRMRYLLGQLYAKQGSNEKAYQAFDKLHGLNTPYLYSFNATMQQASFADEQNKQDVLSKLNKMSKGAKNKEYLDQIYGAIGNIYLNEQDTVKAVENYHKAIKESTRNGYDKAMTQVTLGDVYFVQRKFVEAQPCYNEALDALDKNHEDYAKVTLRSAVLDELVDYVKAVHLQDSLQHLASLPEAERLLAIDKIIVDIKKKEEEEKKLAEKENRQSNDFSPTTPLFEPKGPAIPQGPVITGGGEGKFYFYNPQLVSQGKQTFQRKWGNRKLEDNWRRKNKQLSLFDATADNGTDTLSLEPNGAVINKENIAQLADSLAAGEDDKYSREFYLQQIPLTPEAIDESNEIIEDAYFNMGKIYKDILGDYSLAIEAFDTDLKRFPNTPNLEEIYYQLFLIYLRLNNKEMIELYRSNILNRFPDGSYAASLVDANYEWNLRNMHQLEDNFYQETYTAYLGSKVNTVRDNYLSMKKKFPLSNLVPKFMFLNALTYAQTNQPEQFSDNLTELIKKYPKADVTEVAAEMLKSLKDGKALAADSSPARGMIWNIKFGEAAKVEGEAAPGVDFVTNADAEHVLLLIYKAKSIDKNELIYSVADYNFSKFVYQTFDLSFSKAANLDILQIKGFKTFKDINEYVDLAFDKNSLMDRIDPSVIAVPISVDNFIALMNGKTLNQYFIFFEQHYTKEMLKLVMYWNKQRQKMMDEAQVEELPVDPLDKQDPVKPIEVVPSPAKPTIPAAPQDQKKDDKVEVEVGVEDVLPDDLLEKADNIINKAKAIIDNPADGLKALFNSRGDDDGLTKEEKQQQKAERKKQKDEVKRRQKEAADKEKAKIDAELATQKAKDDALKQAQQEQVDKIKNAKKAKEDAAKNRKEEIKQREKQRKENLKIREKERKEALKKREAERKKQLK